MKWVTVKETHVNTNNLDAFWWYEGELNLLFNADPKPVSWDDPDRQLYLELCFKMGAEPVEDSHG